ncbi:MAG: methyltransferase [Mycobacteriaceae bacterium]|nr:methyltransferase [Mycobacteriaceae bacterium]
MADSIWDLADLATPMAVRVAATLRVGDHIAAGRTSAEAIAADAGVDAPTLDRVLKHLVTAGVLTTADGGYGLTELGEQLRGETGVRAWLDIDGAVGRADLCFVDMLHTVRTGEPAFPQRYGRDFWADLAADPVLSDSFDALMEHHADEDRRGVGGSYDWGSLGSIVDVGGGNGTLLTALLRRYPLLRGTVVDLAGPAAAARKAFHDNELSDRADAVAGSFFDPLPAGAGGYLLSSVIHDWCDEDARAILRRCAEAAAPRGRVFVIETIGADAHSPSTEMDLRMLAYVNGKERTADEYTALAASAGLRTAALHPAGPEAWILELTP